MVIPLHDDNPTERFPIVTVLIIAVNVLVYVLLQPHGGTSSRFIGLSREDAFTYEHAAIPCELRQHDPLTISEVNSGRCERDGSDRATELYPRKNVWLAVIASIFLHGSILHLAGNMLFLWIFGNNVEDHLGHVAYVVFYLVVGFAAMAAHYLADPSSVRPVIGASGAIAGVMGAYLVLWPRARVLTLLLFFVLYLPASVVLTLWFGLQFLTSPNSGVAWVAHVGGFISGALITLALRPVLGPPRLRPVERPRWEDGPGRWGAPP
jgi:membrane associated rhomboid family serine protease